MAILDRFRTQARHKHPDAAVRLAFVEEIPLEETRAYVKRCLRSYAAYRYLYGEGKGRVPRVPQSVAAR